MINVKCNIKNVTSEDNKTFKSSHCLILISVGQQAHEGEHFQATVDLINKTFAKCSISIYDSIQRYTMALNSNKKPSAFHTLANEEGKLWRERSKKFMAKLNNLESVFHWDQWLSHENFFRYKKILFRQ